MFNEGNQIHKFMSSSGSGSLINYGSGSGSDFLTLQFRFRFRFQESKSYGSYGSGFGSGSGSTTLDKHPGSATLFPDQVCQEAWNTMRNLMGTHLGHSALYNLCQIIQTSTSATDIALIRGAVFFIGRELTYHTISVGDP